MKWFFDLQLLDVQGKRVSDPKVRVTFHRPQGTVTLKKAGPFVMPLQNPIEMSSPPGQLLRCEITPSLYYRRRVFFTPQVDTTVSRRLVLFRDPKAWTFNFAKWNALGAGFNVLKQVLLNSRSVGLIPGGKNGNTNITSIGRFTGNNYDNVQKPELVLAKACLLNLYAKLRDVGVPMSGRNNWFAFVREILLVGSERFVAKVDPAMFEVVKLIHGNLGAFVNYKDAPAGGHHRNFPTRYQAKKKSLLSIKSDEDVANLQLTLAEGTEPGAPQAPVVLLDADIDEHGGLFDHIFDIIKHKKTGELDSSFMIVTPRRR